LDILVVKGDGADGIGPGLDRHADIGVFASGKKKTQDREGNDQQTLDTQTMVCFQNQGSLPAFAFKRFSQIPQMIIISSTV
jgi:hypothetical protein